MSKQLTSVNSEGRYSEITGVILAGGKSSRMGTEKAYLQILGRPFIQILADLFQQLFHHVVISSDVSGKFQEFGIPVISDTYHNCGPLGGIHSSLDHSPTSHIFVLSCDTPLLSRNAIHYLISSAEENKITIGWECRNTHPLVGIYPRSILRSIERYLLGGERKVTELLNNLPHHSVDLSSWHAELVNINDPVQYDVAIKATQG